jgi:hypothetical protein
LPRQSSSSAILLSIRSDAFINEIPPFNRSGYFKLSASGM